MKTLKLDHHSYHQYVEGNEIRCEAGLLSDKDPKIGDHVLVFKDTAAAYTSAGVPKREMQSNYIGVEGVITAIDVRDNSDEVSIKKI